MKVTISDVARLAGVSTATVSHTINNTRYVSGNTKEKVYQAIRQLGYTPDASTSGEPGELCNNLSVGAVFRSGSPSIN